MKLERVLPIIVATLTRHPRYLPKIQWSSKSWTHNIFRVYELIFWRRYGIRKESASWISLANGKSVFNYELYTFESICAHIETLIRNFFNIRWLDVRLANFQFAIPLNTPQLQIPFISLAIALDVAASSADTGTSPASYSHTSTGSNLLMVVGGCCKASSTAISMSSVTYNSIGLNKVRTDAEGATTNTESTVWLLHNPSTGANTVSAAFAGGSSPHVVAGSVTYTGAQQSSSADAVNGLTGTTGGSQTFTVTTVSDNCWVFCNVAMRGATSPTLTAGQTQRWNVSGGAGGVLGGEDTNGPKTPAGAQTMGWTLNGTVNAFSMSGASFAPAGGGGGAATIKPFTLLGVG